MHKPVGRRGISVLLCLGLLLFWGLSSAGAANIFLETGGQVVAEGEHYSASLPDPAGTHTWEQISGAAGPFTNARGDLMQVLPNAELNNNVNDPWGNVLTASPLLNYVTRVSTPGDYRLFLRWAGDTGSNDSIYGSIVELRDGQGGAADWYRFEDEPDDADLGTSSWDGSGEFEGVAGSGNDVDAVWTISAPADYTVQIIRREDGAALDTLLLQAASLAAPTGLGPAESVIVPEPSTLVLLGLGCLAVLIRARFGR